MKNELLLLALLGGLPACGGPPWTAGEKEEAFRLCRAEVGFPPISVFNESGPGFGTFMCQCEVDYLADRVPHARFTSALYLSDVNKVLSAGRTECLYEYRNGGR